MFRQAEKCTSIEPSLSELSFLQNNLVARRFANSGLSQTTHGPERRFDIRQL
jgi:hypothetical protein